MNKRMWTVLALTIAVVAALVWMTRPAAAPERPAAPRWPGFTPVPPAAVHPPQADPQPAGPQPAPAVSPPTDTQPPKPPDPAAPAPRGRPLDPNKVLNAIRGADGRTQPRGAVRTGTLAGTLTGLRQGESGGAFAIKGEYTFSNVTEDDLYDFGGWADSEAHVGEDGTFAMKELEAGHYTIIAFSMRNVGTANAEFFYTQGGIDIVAGAQARISLSLH